MINTLAISMSGLTPRLRTSRVQTSWLPWKPARTGLNSMLMHSSTSSVDTRPSCTYSPSNNISKYASVVYVTTLALACRSCTRFGLNFAKSTDLLLLRSHICVTLTLSTTVSGADTRYVRHSRHTGGDPQKQSVFRPALEALCG